jgi:puromycin-sensitive aminopeptidase
VAFGLSRETAMATDGLATTRPVEFPVARPEEAEAMFDVLTYQKGAAVLRMLERYLGAERFREGIRHYLSAHEHGNAETTDLWDAIEAVTGEPVRATMDSWIFQGGHPIVFVEPTADRTALQLEQRRFRYLPGPGADANDGPRWQVPLLVRAGGDHNRRDAETVRSLLTGSTGTVEPAGAAGWAVVNAGGWGFYRVRYGSELLPELVSRIDELEPLERCNLLGDTWAAVLAGLAPASDFLGLVRGLTDEEDPNVWELALGDLAIIDRVIGTTNRPRLQRFVQHLARPALARLGWRRSAAEPERAGVLRADLVQALGTFGADPDVRATAAGLHAGLLEGHDVGDPNLLSPLVRVVAETGGEASYETFLDRFRHPANPQEEVRYLYALALFPETALVARTLELALSEVRTQNAPFLIQQALSNREPDAREMAWEFVKRRWDDINGRLPGNTIRRMLEGVVALCTPELAADAHAFLEAHPVHSGQQIVAQILERLDVHVAFGAREGPGLVAALSDLSARSAG